MLRNTFPDFLRSVEKKAFVSPHFLIPQIVLIFKQNNLHITYRASAIKK